MKNALLALALLAAAAPAHAWERLDGQYSGVKNFHTQAVADEAAWKELWARHAPGQPVPEVQFDREQVAAVFLGQTLTGGVSVDVTVQPDPLDASRIVVFYKPVNKDSRRGFATTVISHPFAIVKTRRAAAVVFEQNARVSIPEADRKPSNPVDGRRLNILIETLGVPSFDGR